MKQGHFQEFGFFSTQSEKRFCSRVFTEFDSVFGLLLIAAVMGGAISCVDSVFSLALNKLEEIEAIARPLPALAKLSADPLWSDPRPLKHSFQPSKRGVGWFFN
jgi:diadenosine tetraphosphatase ApaH/serine/threonine PP2A family protein phosphatase